MKRKLRFTCFAVFLFFLLAAPVQGAEQGFNWKEVYNGVRYLRCEKIIEGKPVRFYAVSIDLDLPGLIIAVSRPGKVFIRTSDFARETGAQIAINGGFWDWISKKPRGLWVSEGKKADSVEDNANRGFFAVSRNGVPWISPPGEAFVFSPEKEYMAVSGEPMVVRQGQPREEGKIEYTRLKQPRSAIGIDKLGKSLFLVVSDGRQKESSSISLMALGEFMASIGVWDGLNIDGGGSSVLYIEKEGGVVNKPSDGRERKVLNCVTVSFGR